MFEALEVSRFKRGWFASPIFVARRGGQEPPVEAGGESNGRWSGPTFGPTFSASTCNAMGHVETSKLLWSFEKCEWL